MFGSSLGAVFTWYTGDSQRSRILIQPPDYQFKLRVLIQALDFKLPRCGWWGASTRPLSRDWMGLAPYVSSVSIRWLPRVHLYLSRWGSRRDLAAPQPQTLIRCAAPHDLARELWLPSLYRIYVCVYIYISCVHRCWNYKFAFLCIDICMSVS